MAKNRDIIFKAIRLIRLFETGRPVTVRDVMNKLDISKSSARRWIDNISLHMPIYEYTTPDTKISWMNPVRYILRKD